ncbi:tRNA (cytosine34-C5)-methyltransferase [Angomonas deanei]|uniref:16S rRNA methyltransferase RsmB/F/FtsJ-like methyltransferase, putative n=1 Tax=Angomonas deanei TaxID=59799 RepID=A0A7G2CJ48_9TRYP|nr:tRNA (cytosine34-C5)-methyltransferase [Angomonas deanei]CAD2218643.1 16S rRNA methyltransferase RsmB/F/FtsJ-like methyltransferase, putative [Angomonas deanei]|eukprot:EPY40765.1 tRNA (cytosine34-C5)-methyltransferase [Angomonas deanei]
MECLRTSLPMSFRVNFTLEKAHEVLAYLEKRLSEFFSPLRIPFFPQQMAIQCEVSRSDLKRNEEYKEVKKILTAFSECGYVTRQETVSMIPPILLQVEPGHRVLDVCAAPGSKTSQILEYLMPSKDSGVLVANDLNASRLDVLNRQTNRAPHAHQHLIITNYDATRFPILPSEDKFDRVLCDVVCSGDGTLRKSLDMWPRWNTVQGADLHNVQIRMLLRGMANCKKGGIVVYSTCSLNPVEDEAVVSETLRKVGSSFCLMDIEHLLPGFQTAPGLTSWDITTKDLGTVLHNHAEALEYMKAQDGKGFQYKASMFATEADLVQQNISYARRILPHLQDSGGFFVAAFRCVEELPDTPSEPEGDVSIAALSPEYAQKVKASLSLPDDFPLPNLIHRPSASREQKIYYAVPPVIELAAKLGKRVIHVGSKVFESFIKYSDTKLRFCEDGIGSLPYILPSSFVVPCNQPYSTSLPGINQWHTAHLRS